MSLSIFAQPTTGIVHQPQKTPATAAADSCYALAAFKKKIHDAIDAALKYPAKMAFSSAKGITTIEYDYLNGYVTNIWIRDSSGDSVLDRAAVTAVKHADYASIQPAIHNKLIHDRVFIIFDNTAILDKSRADTGVESKSKSVESDCTDS